MTRKLNISLFFKEGESTACDTKSSVADTKYLPRVYIDERKYEKAVHKKKATRKMTK